MDTLKDSHKRHLQQYIIGFISSVALTLIAYFYTVGGLGGWGLTLALAALAVIQVIVQLVFFLHLRDEREPRWKLLTFDFALLIIAILVFGTLWIMANLDRHMVTPQQSKDYDDYIVKDEGYDR